MGGTFVALIFILTGSGQMLHRLKTPLFGYSKKIICVLSVLILAISGHAVVKATDYLPVRIATETKDALHQYKEYGKAKAQREARLQQLQGLKITSDGGIFVLVIGESETRDHMGAYGYDRDTTPWMTEEAQKPEAILFRNAYSNHTHTVPVLTYALSEKNQYNDVPLEKAYSLIEIAKAAGYDTFWISNQRKYGAWDTPVAEIASTAAHQAWLNERTGTHDLRSDYYDDVLVKALPDLTKEKNALIVIHLMGCHGSYADRYPEDWKHYSGKSDVIDKYDNAVRYNDYVLQQLYTKLKENPRFKGFIYLSDHGDDVEHNYGHEASKFTATMSHIPLFMVVSPSFQAERPQIVETLRSHRDSYWTNDLLYNVMTDILGIRGVPGTDLNWDLASPQYSMTKDTLRTLHGKQVLQ
jgi:heptose-I-phosphate ethanolaminephosphotransferase